MNALQMPPLAVVVDDDGQQSLVVPLARHELPDGTRIYELAEVWTTKQSAS